MKLLIKKMNPYFENLIFMGPFFQNNLLEHLEN